MSKIITPSYQYKNVSYDKNILLIKLFESQAAKFPNQIAYKYKKEFITYQELDESANRFANMLIEKYEIKNNPTIAIKMERSIELFISILAVLKTGASFLVIDSNIAQERTEYLLHNSESQILIYKNIKHALPNIPCEEYSEVILQYPSKCPNIEYSGSDTAYIIYTSGSTGRPKGIMISNYSLVNRLLWMINEFKLNNKDVFFQKSSLMFDVSIWEYFCGLICGASIILLEHGQEGNVGIIIKTIIEERITICHFVPVFLSQFLYFAEQRKLIEKMEDFRYIISSGEALKYQTVLDFNRIFHCKKTQMYNLYGPAEAAIDVTYFNCTGYTNVNHTIPIGKPIWNTKIYIMQQNELCDEGQIGEIYISGDNVGKGYINSNKVESDRFIPDPYWPGNMMYRTGDLGRWVNEFIEYIGRCDNQINIMGIRIEPEEIENLLAEYPSIDMSVVCVYKEIFLVCLFVSKKEIVGTDLRNYLLKFLKYLFIS